MSQPATVTLDVSGLVCPQPVLVVRRCLAELEPGEAAVVTGDHRPAEHSIRRTCETHGYEVTSESSPEAEFRLRIRVPDPAEPTPVDGPGG